MINGSLGLGIRSCQKLNHTVSGTTRAGVMEQPAKIHPPLHRICSDGKKIHQSHPVEEHYGTQNAPPSWLIWALAAHSRTPHYERKANHERPQDFLSACARAASEVFRACAPSRTDQQLDVGNAVTSQGGGFCPLKKFSDTILRHRNDHPCVHCSLNRMPSLLQSHVWLDL
jgi:hypothetical protein